MIAHWMLYCMAVGSVLVLGAATLERALRTYRLPTRWVWVGALLLTVAIPAAYRFVPREAPSAPAAPPPAAIAGEGERISPAALLAGDAAVRRLDLAALERPLRLAWGAASAATLLALLGMTGLLRRRRRRWRSAELAGVPVLVSRDTGPAVVGLFRSRIVLPEWAVGTDPARLDLLLAHEQEHVRAGDPRLLALGFAALVLTPWNPAVWWQLRRLRLAVEIDCDARVLRRRDDVRAYGSLLLEVGRRASGSPLAAAAFSEPTSFLERRIRIMTLPRPRSPWARAAGFGALSVGLVVAACETPAPTPLAPVPAERVYAAPDAPEGLKPAKVTPREAMAAHFPEVLTRGMQGNDYAMFVISHEGEVVASRLGTSGAGNGGLEFPDAGLDAATIETVNVMKMAAGQMGPDPVGVIWVQLRDPAAPPRTASTDPSAPGSVKVRVRAADSAAGGAVDIATPGAQRITIRAGEGDGVTATARITATARGEGSTPRVDLATVTAAIERHHPGVAGGNVAPQHLWFVVGADGEVVSTGDDRDPGFQALSPDAIEAVDVFKNTGVRVGEKEVGAIWIRLKG